ncbi:class I SAM-dependent methyltransferase [Halomonas sp. 18H]|uniref:class I SAM-dependent methyltransferase n=1 Tax=Halomonas almeriensis TaxID=308163 RepID=UPI00222E94DA|nr:MULTISPECIES: class I SAM-dependent methyltransferase [Halomonas]MCW4151784.1 class I SAM-dependent methyltransferase [Halomonas sp. 18H]MDN3554030.1 class I SAM-dependent methyltransferase [Halomonas almeriensis]
MASSDFTASPAMRHSPAAVRNRQPILEVLQAVLPEQAEVLELASGSGEHALHCATAMPGWRWQPSDLDDESLASIEAWRSACGPGNLASPIRLDATREWPSGKLDAIVAINLVHISPWQVTEALMARAGETLIANGVLYLYGPYRRHGQHTSASNATFDADLQRRDPRWGVRDLDRVLELAGRHGLVLERVVEMPANNLSVVLRRHGSNAVGNASSCDDDGIHGPTMSA